MVRGKVAVFARREQRRIFSMEVESMLGVCINLWYSSDSSSCQLWRDPECTFFILARRKLLTRNLKRSSSVCIIISLKLVFGSMFPVWSSTSSICSTLSIDPVNLGLEHPSVPAFLYAQEPSPSILPATTTIPVQLSLQPSFALTLVNLLLAVEPRPPLPRQGCRRCPFWW